MVELRWIYRVGCNDRVLQYRRRTDGKWVDVPAFDVDGNKIEDEPNHSYDASISGKF